MYTSEDGVDYYLWKENRAQYAQADWYNMPEGEAVVSLGIEFEDFDIPFAMNRYEDAEQNKTAQRIEIYGANRTAIYSEQIIEAEQEYNEETGKYESGKRTIIRMVSDFLWFSLDAWGRNFPESEQPQCTTAGDCLG